MNLDEFIDKIFCNLSDAEQIENIKETIRNNMNEYNKYDNTRVECQVYTEENNYEPRVEITSESYNDAEVVFIDFHVDEKLK